MVVSTARFDGNGSACGQVRSALQRSTSRFAGRCGGIFHASRTDVDARLITITRVIRCRADIDTRCVLSYVTTINERANIAPRGYAAACERPAEPCHPSFLFIAKMI